MTRFESIKAERAARPATTDASPGKPKALSNGASHRAGKKAVSGYFSVEMSRALHALGLEEDKSLQALMGEAFDDLLRKYGKHPFGER